MGDVECEARPTDAAQGRHPRRRPQPHRPGHRVRLLLLPRLLRADQGRLRDDHDQLQPRDRLDRLRHLRPPLFRAADPRARPRDPPRRAGERHAARRHRPVRRPDAAEARQRPARRRHPDPRHHARRHRPRRGPRALPEAPAPARPAPAASTASPAPPTRRMAVAEARSAIPLVIRPSYVLGGRAMEIVRDDAQLTRYITDAVHVSGDTPGPARQLPLQRHRGRRRRASPTARDVHVAGVMEHIEEAGVHSGDSACSLPPYSLDADTVAELEAPDRSHGARPRRRRPDERPVRHPGRRHLRPRGQPPRLAAPCPSSPRPPTAPSPPSPPASWPASRSSNFPLRAPYPDGVGPDDRPALRRPDDARRPRHALVLASRRR